MDKNETNSFMDNLNLLLVGAVLGCFVGACFMSNYHTGNSKKAEKKLEAYEKYYKCTETLLDSLDGTHNLDLMDTDLATDYGSDYLDAKSKVDELIAK
nr:MAG TPA: Lipopolysaccharide assembly protein A domain [Bacteriophage sp.]